MLLNTFKNKKFKKTQKNPLESLVLWVFLGVFFGFYWVGFLMPTLTLMKAIKNFRIL